MKKSLIFRVFKNLFTDIQLDKGGQRSRSLDTTTVQIWPQRARQILKAKGISRRKLKKIFKKVVFPGNPSYDSYRFFFELEISELPLFVVVFKNQDEAPKLMDLMLKYKLTLRVINGRHSSCIQNPEVYADISQLNKISLEKDDILQAQGGATQGQIYEYLFSLHKDTDHKHLHFPGAKISHSFLSFALHSLNNTEELSFNGGSAGSVSAVGITTAIGISTLKRTLGLTADSVTSFTIAISPSTSPDNNVDKAKIVIASDDENRDLFWALRGGLASNFGIVVEMTFKVAPIENIIVYSVSFPSLKNAERVLDFWQNTAPNRSSQFNEDFSGFVSTPSNDVGKVKNSPNVENIQGIGIGGLYVIPSGETIHDAKKRVANELAPYQDKFDGKVNIHASTYHGSIKELARNRANKPFSSAKIFFTKTKVDSHAVIENLKNVAKSRLPGLHLFGIELMGGKISKVGPRETAFYPRESKFFVELFSYWDSALDTCGNQMWVTSLFEKLYNPKKDYVYVGFPINNLPNHLNAYYGKNKNRLLRIKKQVDPFNLLHFPTGIIEQ